MTVINATTALLASGGSARPSGTQAASLLAKEDHMWFSKDYPTPEFETTQEVGLPRHPTKNYAERQPICDPYAVAGKGGYARTMSVLREDGSVAETTRVASGLDLGHVAPLFVSEAMRQANTTEVKLTKIGGWNRNIHSFAPRPFQRHYKGDHPALRGPTSP